MSRSSAELELVLIGLMESDLIGCTDFRQAPSMTTATSIPLDGQLLTPGDAGYDAARTIWNAMIDHRPRMIVRAASVADVVTAVRLARELDLELGVRCGGHNVAGFAVPEGGLMIDLTPLSGVRVDPVQIG